ncbi:MAG: mechanosensitive ion channel family protein [Aigarchaeota archaeon]|nr:mechanosensitive ion channel family protein [Aigarchaeota archaeon]MDW8092235.1 mechanosensitive ion channel family protein [Nitrososphaerota archaeon]
MELGAIIRASLALVTIVGVYEISIRLLKSYGSSAIISQLIRGSRVIIIVGLLALAIGDIVDIISPNLPTELSVYLSRSITYLIASLIVLFLGIRLVINLITVTIGISLIDKRVLKVVYAALYLLAVVVAIRIIVGSQIFPSIGPTEWRVLNFVNGLVAVYVFASIVELVLHKLVQEREREEAYTATAYTFLRRLASIGVWILGIIALLLVVFPELLGLVASVLIAAGFLSIVIGLAAQSTLSNLISGLMIAITQPFRLGDAVMFRNDFCYVEDIRLFHTVLRTWDNRRVVVPNSIFQSETIIDYTTVDPSMIVPVTVDVSYESDVDAAISVMKELAEKHPDFLPAPGLPSVQVMELGESGVRLRLLTKAKDQPTAFNMSKDLLYQIKKEFERRGIEIPYPRRYVILDKGAKKKRRTP